MTGKQNTSGDAAPVLTGNSDSILCSERYYPTGWPNSSDWTAVLGPMFAQPEFQELWRFVERERASGPVFPAATQVFEAFCQTSLEQTRVVILGQYPYHGAGQAQGLSFSVPAGVRVPPSLRNIFRELHDDLGCPIPDRGDLTSWARQGVLLLNTVLTVRESEAHSHRGRGWEWFTDHVIRSLSTKTQRVVFLLWGKQAEQKRELIAPRHRILSSPHPSPLSARRGFFGSRPFSTANQLLTEAGLTPIEWCRLSTDQQRLFAD